MFYGDFVSNFFSLDSILFALFDILTLFQGRLPNASLRKTLMVLKKVGISISKMCNLVTNNWTHFYAAFTSNCTGLTKSNDE
ncbi:hypothetical protein [Leptospira interrogans]|uniref:hypothetical protein n=1 Tax=Leptospira interrogans TaxID=173 RepID=UPI002F267DC1